MAEFLEEMDWNKLRVNGTLCTVEELYQAFAKRLQEDLVAHRIVDVREGVQRLEIFELIDHDHPDFDRFTEGGG